MPRVRNTQQPCCKWRFEHMTCHAEGNQSNHLHPCGPPHLKDCVKRMPGALFTCHIEMERLPWLCMLWAHFRESLQSVRFEWFRCACKVDLFWKASSSNTLCWMQALAVEPGLAKKYSTHPHNFLVRFFSGLSRLILFNSCWVVHLFPDLSCLSLFKPVLSCLILFHSCLVVRFLGKGMFTEGISMQLWLESQRLVHSEL